MSGLENVPAVEEVRVLSFFLKIVSCLTLCPALPSDPVLLFTRFCCFQGTYARVPKP